MEKKVIKVDEKIRDYIESIDYELGARKELVAFMLENNMKVNTDAFKKYQHELTEYSIKFKLAKNELEKQYVFPAIGDAKVNWRLDYSTSELTITFLED